MQRKINLPNGNYLLITFEREGVAYDLYDEGDNLLKKYGLDLYTQNLGLEVKKVPFPFRVA